MQTREELEQKLEIYATLSFFVLFFGALIMLTLIVLIHRLSALIISILSFLTFILYGYLFLKIYLNCKRFGIDILTDESVSSLWVIYMVMVGALTFSVTFALLYLNYIELSILSLITIFGGSLLLMFMLSLKRAVKRRRTSKRMSIRIGFNKSKLPIAILDGIFGLLMIYCSTLMNSFFSSTLTAIGIIFIILGILNLSIVKIL